MRQSTKDKSPSQEDQRAPLPVAPTKPGFAQIQPSLCQRKARLHHHNITNEYSQFIKRSERPPQFLTERHAREKMKRIRNRFQRGVEWQSSAQSMGASQVGLAT